MGTKYITRHGLMRFLGEAEAAEGARYARGQRVVLRTDRGQELGEVLCEAHPKAVELIAEPAHGQILRPLTDADEPEL